MLLCYYHQEICHWNMACRCTCSPCCEPTQDCSKGIRKSKSENFGRRPRSSAEGQGWFPMATVDSWMGLGPWALGLLNDVKGNTFSHFPCILKGTREVEVSRIGWEGHSAEWLEFRWWRCTLDKNWSRQNQSTEIAKLPSKCIGFPLIFQSLCSAFWFAKGCQRILHVKCQVRDPMLVVHS